MKQMFTILTITSFILAACSKNDNRDKKNPSASFSFNTSYSHSDTSQLIRLETYDWVHLNNNSSNADDYLWDFGNGTTTTDENPDYWYSKSGLYTLTLTASMKDGTKSVTKRTVKVLDRVAKQIVITSLNPRSALGWASVYPNPGKLSLWVEVLFGDPGKTYPLSNYGVPQRPVVYKTAIATDIDSSRIPFSFDITEKLAINIQMFNGYIFNLYAKDNNSTYLLFSSHGSGIGSSMWGGIPVNSFEIVTGFEGSNLSVKGSFE
jgi:PKD repeat protein